MRCRNPDSVTRSAETTMQAATDNMNQLVMIIGASHSGTTLLDLMLGNHPETFSCGEVYAYFRPWRKHHYYAKCGCGKDPCPVWDKLMAVPEDGFHQAAASLPGINHVVDSSKDLSWVLKSSEWARRSGMHVRHVVIWKEPIQLAYSHWKRKQPLNSFRHDFLVYYGRFLKLGLPFVSVNFDTLVSNPAETIRKLCELVGLPWREGQEEFWNKEHHQLFGAASTGQQASAGNSRIETRKDYPEQFLSKYEPLLSDLANNSRFLEIIAALEEKEIGKDSVPSFTGRANPPKPLWYYMHAIKRVFFRRFPKEYRSRLDSDMAQVNNN